MLLFRPLSSERLFYVGSAKAKAKAKKRRQGTSPSLEVRPPSRKLDVEISQDGRVPRDNDRSRMHRTECAGPLLRHLVTAKAIGAHSGTWCFRLQKSLKPGNSRRLCSSCIS